MATLPDASSIGAARKSGIDRVGAPDKRVVIGANGVPVNVTVTKGATSGLLGLLADIFSTSIRRAS